jgi:IS5 family transposase
VEELFDLFDGFLKNKGYLARGGQIIDATIVAAPKHRARITRRSRRNAGRLEIQAGQKPPEGQGRALDEEA